jgi:site-specific recombinase XerD
MKSRSDLAYGQDKVERFLTDLAVRGNVASATQYQAFHALRFLYGQVLEQPVQGVNAVRAKRPPRVPVVLTVAEARQVIGLMSGPTQLVVKLMYGSGLRLMEALRLRVQEVDFKMLEVVVREGKGFQDRLTPLAVSMVPALQEHLVRVRARFEADQQQGLAGVWLPGALDRKWPDAGKEWGWQWVFPSQRISEDPRGDACAGSSSTRRGR